MRLEHLLSGENAIFWNSGPASDASPARNARNTRNTRFALKPSASLLPKFINIEKDEAERSNGEA